MEGYSSSESNISLDSLETEFKKKSNSKHKRSEEKIQTILVPFYEKDVLIKVPKGKNTKDIQEANKGKYSKDESRKVSPPAKNYLVNKDAHKSKRTSYLEMFRKQFGPPQTVSRKVESEIRSISPEFGDTERESFGEEHNHPVTDFFNTESYNEIYYEKLINQELNNYLEQSYEEQLKFTGDIRSKSPDDVDYNNLKSISDVSQPRRHARRATVQPIQNVKLGGLGPDMENIKPRLERARSLQRYSEKVRMENRVKIYKKSVQEDIEKKAEKEVSIKRQESAKNKGQKDSENTYLVNKNIQAKQSPNIRHICNSKSKSANVSRSKGRNDTQEQDQVRIKNNNINQNSDQNKKCKNPNEQSQKSNNKERVKSCKQIINNNNNNNTDAHTKIDVPPVHISFLVNMGGIRPSSALRTLEAKHRMYQEKVKAFTTNNDKDNNSKD